MQKIYLGVAIAFEFPQYKHSNSSPKLCAHPFQQPSHAM